MHQTEVKVLQKRMPVYRCGPSKCAAKKRSLRVNGPIHRSPPTNQFSCEDFFQTKYSSLQYLFSAHAFKTTEAKIKAVTQNRAMRSSTVLLNNQPAESLTSETVDNVLVIGARRHSDVSQSIKVRDVDFILCPASSSHVTIA